MTRILEELGVPEPWRSLVRDLALIWCGMVLMLAVVLVTS